VAEGAPLLREYVGKTCIEGSNPSDSASDALAKHREAPKALRDAPCSGAFSFRRSPSVGVSTASHVRLKMRRAARRGSWTDPAPASPLGVAPRGVQRLGSVMLQAKAATLLQRLSGPSRVLLVLGGYLLAALAAAAAAWSYIAMTPTVDRVLSSGMTAFGDSLVFLAALAIASIPATGVALYYARPYRHFWSAALIVSLLASLTAVLAAAVVVAAAGHGLAMLASLRILIAPAFALAALLLAAFVPTIAYRLGFLVAAVVEAGSFVFAVTLWLVSSR
jgi:hypothetical protein